MNRDDVELIEAAKAVVGGFCLRDEFSAGTVGAAIRTAKGNIYTGICIDLACGLGFCAEVAAVAEMLKHRETQIVAVVAVGREGVLVGPCGRCRETMAQVDRRNLRCRILLSDGRETLLQDLLPKHWLEDLRSAKPSRGANAAAPRRSL
ncbi:MAG: cytidine deaminase [Verrucomicrobia bacterium]|nr:cytidine deaminase [Verrucomicrobiota bacterium]